MDAGYQTPSTLPMPTLPPPGSSGYPTPPLPTPTYSAPARSGLDGSPPGRPPARWTSAAKATVAVLTLTTIGGVGFGISQFTRVNDRTDQLEAVQARLATANDDLDASAGELDRANGASADLQAQLGAVTAQLGDVTARRDTLASFFPLTADVLANVAPKGSWGLVNTPDPEQCDGFSDPAASCVGDNFPTDIVIDGTPEGGYTASSAWYPPIPLAFDGSRWTGSGSLSDGYSNTCGGEVNTTTVTLDFAVTGAGADESAGVLFPAELRGTVSLVSDETASCVGASRGAGFVTAAG